MIYINDIYHANPVEEYYGSEFQVIPIKRFLSRALTYIHTNIQTYIHLKSKQYPRRLHYVIGMDNKGHYVTSELFMADQLLAIRRLRMTTAVCNPAGYGSHIATSQSTVVPT